MASYIMHACWCVRVNAPVAGTFTWPARMYMLYLTRYLGLLQTTPSADAEDTEADMARAAQRAAKKRAKKARRKAAAASALD